MVVDKFGRQYMHSSDNGDNRRGPPGIGFKLTLDGNYDIEQKRICNVQDPQGPLDAVNRQSTLIVQENQVNARKRRIVDLADPINFSDAATKQYVHKYTGVHYLSIDTKDFDRFDAKRCRISNVNRATEPNDVITKVELETVANVIKGKHKKMMKRLKDINEILKLELLEKNSIITGMLKAFYLVVGDLVLNMRNIHRDINLVGKMSMADLNSTYKQLTDILAVPSASSLVSLIAAIENDEDEK